jgi:hypothetical protein
VVLEAVQEIHGHATIDMTTRQLHLSPNVKREAVHLLDAAPPSRARAHVGHGITEKSPPANQGARWSGKRDLNTVGRG